MKAAAILGAAALLSTLSVDAVAKTSSASEYRGYANCVEAADGDLAGLVTDRTYFINRSAESNQYFVNGSAWTDGERVDVRVQCDTSRNGRELLDVSIAEGAYVLDRGEVNVRVAAN